MALNQFSGTNGFLMMAAGATAGDPVRAGASAGASYAFASSSTGYSANTWTHACGVFTTTTSRTAYINGGSAASNTTSRSPTGVDTVIVGNNRTGGAWGSTATVIIAEVGIWNVALNADEIAALAKGFRPDQIRPQSLRFYTPLVREIIDVRGGLALTTAGITVATHPRIY